MKKYHLITAAALFVFTTNAQAIENKSYQGDFAGDLSDVNKWEIEFDTLIAKIRTNPGNNKSAYEHLKAKGMQLTESLRSCSYYKDRIQEQPCADAVKKARELRFIILDINKIPKK
jgi:hypothetical protein